MLVLALTSRFCSDQTPPSPETGPGAASKHQALLGRSFLDFISVKWFKDVEVLESTQRAPENAAQAMESVT